MGNNTQYYGFFFFFVLMSAAFRSMLSVNLGSRHRKKSRLCLNQLSWSGTVKFPSGSMQQAYQDTPS